MPNMQTMRDGFDVCTTCDRHIKRTEPTCPFCNAPHVPQRQASRRALPRMSRAQWLALGSSLAVAACGGQVAPATSGDPSAKQLAGEQVAADDASADDAGADDADASAVLVESDAAYTYDSAWQACYGSPPARLERLVGG